MALDLSITDYCLAGGLLLVFVYQVYYYLRYMSGVSRWQRRHKHTASAEETTTTEGEGVSVIVCARNEEQNIQDYLQALLEQDYPKFEVIVVDDGSQDKTQEVAERYAQEYPNLYVTFVPKDAHIISTKKLALTIGAKAAHYEYLLLTDADCRPESRHWIREMVKGFAPHKGQTTEVVLGYGAYYESDTLLNSIISYDTLFNGMQYMGMALSGHPYMGVGRNLAYRRSTFFAHSGFRGMLAARAGDDDLFVNKISTRHNTQVVCSRESLTWSVPKKTWREWLHQKRRHLSVSPNYKTGSKWRLAMEPLSRGLFYALMIAAFVCGSGVVCCLALGLWLLRTLMMLIVMNIGAYRLGQHRLGSEIVIFDILLPLLSLYMLLTQPLVYRRRTLYW